MRKKTTKKIEASLATRLHKAIERMIELQYGKKLSESIKKELKKRKNALLKQKKNI